MTPAKGMIGKEIRQNINWAALGMFGMSAALLWVLWKHRTKFGDYGGYATPGTPLLQEDYQVITVVGCGLIGLLLGLMQILPEKSLDQWAFLVHRPVSRTRIFFYKVIAGLLLYTFAVGVPIAAAVAWVATPGHVPAPFSAELSLPSLADWLAGLGYYFAALIIGLREVRWYGSRILAAGLAVFVSCIAIFMPEFHWALLGMVVTLAILVVAAWGCFLTGGHYDRQPWPAKTAVGIAVFTGIAMLVGVGVAMVATAIPYRVGEQREYSSYSLIQDGRVVRLTRRGQQYVAAHDLAGNSIPDALPQVPHTENDFRQSDVSLLLVRPPSDHTEPAWYRQERRYFKHLYAPGFQNWYYLQDEGYGVGYETKTSEFIGYFGPDGFAAPGDPTPPAARFEGRSKEMRNRGHYRISDTQSLTFLTGLYRVDLDGRKVTRDFVPPPGEELRSVATGQIDADEAFMRGRTPKVIFDAFVTDKSITIRDVDSGSSFTAKLEHTPDDGYDSVTVARRGSGPGRYFLWYQPGYRKGTWRIGKSAYVVELTPTGAVAARHELPPIQRDWRAGPVQPREVVYALGTPPIMMGGNLVTTWQRGGMDLVREWFYQPTTRLMMVTSLLVALVCAFVSLLVAKLQNASVRRRVGWFVVVFLLGPTALLTMLCLAARLRFERCPSCGRSRPVNEEKCRNCGAEFALPAMDGTEIFAM